MQQLFGTAYVGYKIGNAIYEKALGPALNKYWDKQQEYEAAQDKKRVEKSRQATIEHAKTQAEVAEKMDSVANLANKQRAGGGKASAAASVLESAITVKDMGDGKKSVENVDTGKLEAFLSDENNVKNMTAEEREAFDTALSSQQTSIESSLNKMKVSAARKTA